MTDITPEAQSGFSQDQGQQGNTDAATVQAPNNQGAQGNSGPWSNDLESRFTDPGVRGQVDEFLRTTVQPHVTRIEQDHAKYQPAHQLYDDLMQNPQDTWLAVTSELYGPEVAERVQELLSQGGEAQAPNEAQTPETAPQLSREQQEAIEWANRQRSEQHYSSEMHRITEAAKAQNAVIDETSFAPFVAMANGNFDVALQNYIPWQQAAEQSWASRLGLQNGQGAEQAPPPTLGVQASGGATPPTEKVYTSIQDALNDTLAEVKANRESNVAVGSV